MFKVKLVYNNISKLCSTIIHSTVLEHMNTILWIKGKFYSKEGLENTNFYTIGMHIVLL